MQSFGKAIAFSMVQLFIAGHPLVLAQPELAGGTKPPGTVDFGRDIKPIFARYCYDCHGEKKQKSGLRVDQKQSVFQGGDSGKPTVISGKGHESPLLLRILSTDPEQMMPPKGDRLSAEEIAALRKWIDEGARWPEQTQTKKHWAYVKPERPALPQVKRSEWPRNPIDYFVLARLEKEGLKPAPEVERPILLRRLSLDLIGLPPTVGEVDEFVADTSADAVTKVVDRLLASPQYGERWARPWLDLARYADTQGYEKDNRRSMWPYRDWVIDALNRDMPFDQFTIEQLAGDLLPDASRSQKVATGFHRNTMTNTEGGTDNEEFRHEAIVDRVNTTMSVWMGSTFACAQCHNHKYDPFMMKEYYQFYAFLNNTADNDADDEAPVLKLPTPKQERDLARYRENIAELEKTYNNTTPELLAAFAEWETNMLASFTNWQLLAAADFISKGGAILAKQSDGSLLASGKNPSNDVYSVVASTTLSHVTGIRLEVLPDPALPQKSLGRQANGSFVLTGFETAIAPNAETNHPQPVIYKDAVADYSQKGYSVTNLLQPKSGAGWATSAADPTNRVARSAYFTISNHQSFESGTTVFVTLRHDSKFPEANIGRFRLWVTATAEPTPAPVLSEAVRKVLLLAASERNEKQRAQLLAHYRSVAPELTETREELARLRKSEADLEKLVPRTSVLAELAKPRETHLLIRGGFLSKGDPVKPGVPSVLHSLGSNQPPSRLALAQWLVDAENPLTPRVVVNRFWEQFFGVGLVESSEDFGTQGEKPSHPELLDWLATEFMRQKWSMKAMHKLIVTSATYQQSAGPTRELLQRDPYNRLLARGPRIRLEAEMIRDQALAVSGLISKKVGGPSVMPPQPEGLWQVVYSGDKWETSKGQDKYRRGIYTFWRRTNPYPSMTTFDAPSREFCVAKRMRSNTPLQALTILNDPAYIEAAQALARKVIGEAQGKLEDRVAHAFRVCLSRLPRAEEASRLKALFESQLAIFKEDPEAAEKMATSEIGKAPEGADLAELAAWTVVANVLLNLDEMITKG